MTPLPNELVNQLGGGKISILVNGSQHQTFLLTNNKRYVIKKLNFDCYQAKYTALHFEKTEKLAQAVAKTYQLAVQAMQKNKHFVWCEQGEHYLCFPFISGQILKRISVLQAGLIGRSLARIHGLNFIDDYFESMKVTGLEFNYIKIAKLDYLDKANKIQLLDIAEYLQPIIETYSGPEVLSHRDLNLSNIIWQDKLTPIFIDWESAGLISPTIELIGAALNIAGIESAKILMNIFQAVIEGYRAERKIEFIDSSQFDMVLLSWLLWIDYCLSANSPLSSEKRKRQIMQALKAIELIKQYKTDILSALFSF